MRGGPGGRQIASHQVNVGDYTAEHGGGTFDGDMLLPLTIPQGYAVALPGGQELQYRNAEIGPAGRREIARMAQAVRDTFRPPYVGTWRDKVTGSVYVDPVVILPDLDSALILGRALHQKAIYDFAAQKEIDLRLGPIVEPCTEGIVTTMMCRCAYCMEH